MGCGTLNSAVLVLEKGTSHVQAFHCVETSINPRKKNIASQDMAAVSQAIANACFVDYMSWVMHLDREFLVQLID